MWLSNNIMPLDTQFWQELRVIDMTKNTAKTSSSVQEQCKENLLTLSDADFNQRIKDLGYVSDEVKKYEANNKSGNVRLHYAVEIGSIELINHLLANGAEVKVQDKDGFTPLHYAAKWGHKDIVELLLAKGAEVNVQNKDGFTPLHYAAKWEERGHKEIVEKLLAKGAEVNVQSKDGFTPLHYAEEWNHIEVATLLEEEQKRRNIIKKILSILDSASYADCDKTYKYVSSTFGIEAANHGEKGADIKNSPIIKRDREEDKGNLGTKRDKKIIGKHTEALAKEHNDGLHR